MTMTSTPPPAPDDLPARVAGTLAKVPTGILVGGQWRDASDGGRFDVENPATGEILASVASGTADDARAGLAAAAQAQESWARTPSRGRSEVLRRSFDLVTERAQDLALLMTLEMGKPFAESLGEVRYGAEFLRWFAEEAVRNYGRYVDSPEGNLRMLVSRKPVGPAFLITPWNFPLAMATRKVGPALAAGCTTIVKPARLTPLTTLYFAQLMIEAGVPAGVLNVLPTRSAGTVSTPIIADPRLRKLSFTGSTAVGIKLLKQAADHVLRTSMELGGNGPFIVFEDADLDKAVAGAMAAKMRNMGEACTAANRLLVHASLVDEFVERLADRMSTLTVGNGLQPDSTVGPLIEAAARDSVESFVTDARHRGASLVTGGERLDGPGYFFLPTLLRDVPADARLLGEEIFGPVAPVVSFTTEDEAVHLANTTEYGLASYVFTENLARGLRIGDRLEFGLLGLNVGVLSNAAAPFGGVKQSGLGREGGPEGIAEYSSTQYIGIEHPHRSN